MFLVSIIILAIALFIAYNILKSVYRSRKRQRRLERIYRQQESRSNNGKGHDTYKRKGRHSSDSDYVSADDNTAETSSAFLDWLFGERGDSDQSGSSSGSSWFGSHSDDSGGGDSGGGGGSSD